MNLTYYCGGEKILSPPLFQHCVGKRPHCPCYSNAVVHTVASALTVALLAAAAALGNVYWRSTLAITCSLLDAGENFDVKIDRRDRSVTDFRDKLRSPRSKN